MGKECLPLPSLPAPPIGEGEEERVRVRVQEEGEEERVGVSASAKRRIRRVGGRASGKGRGVYSPVPLKFMPSIGYERRVRAKRSSLA